MTDHRFLHQIPLFEGMSHEDLSTLAETVEEVTLRAGEELFHEGDLGDRAFFIKEGEVEILKESSGREILLAVRSTGTVIGEMALLDSIPRTATVRARTNALLYAIQKEDLDRLLYASPAAMQALFSIILQRFRENQVNLQQSEKMAQLGTLTAGVAHELNNPAAAVNRSADQLVAAIQALDSSYAHIARLDFDEKLWNLLEDLSQKANQSAAAPPELDALTRSDRESQIESWLNAYDVEEVWLIAPNLVNLNFTEDELTALAAEVHDERIMCIIEWLNATYNVFSLLNELSVGSGRISNIVKSLKSYAYLDQAPIQSVDVCEGLDNTLTILHHKLKSGINVKREYATDLPQIMGHGSELNQVWTNIIDNAADALADQADAQIILRTRKESDWIVVEIEDNGPGIPRAVLPSIFDAFFTTKGPGRGTGLGLNISYNIVVQKHRGDVKVRSKPGQTVFEV
ncbi:MAG: cyclic nucleotide-binding domain-containing protein, partial [Anaerolineae bacterium]|nr:cyclic nucleotide-binding domain-containing protein [Anaerolineae bacterium]